MRNKPQPDYLRPYQLPYNELLGVSFWQWILENRYKVGSVNEVCSSLKKMVSRGRGRLTDESRFLNDNTTGPVDQINSLLQVGRGDVLCIVGCSAACLAPYWRPEAPPPVVTAKNVSMCCQRSSGQQLPVSEALTDGQQIGWVSSHRAILAALYRCAADPCVPWGWGERVWWLTEGLGYELGLQTLTDLMGKLQLYSLVV